MSTELPPAPPVPPQAPPQVVSKAALWIVLAVIIGGAYVWANLSPTPTARTPVYDEPVGVTADMVVDAMGPAQTAQFCDAYATIGDPSAAFAAFAGSYGVGDPSAREVFDELRSRC